MAPPASAPHAPSAAPETASALPVTKAHAAGSADPARSSDPTAVLLTLEGRRPRRFGDAIPGVLTRFEAKGQAIALTLDLCDGASSEGFDHELFDLLEEHAIVATLFVSGRWIRGHGQKLRELAAEPRYRIENHGLEHRPCTVDGRAAFGIGGTRGLSALVEEVEGNARIIAAATKRWPKFYRPGTAHFDDVCIEALELLNERPLGYTVGADGGTGFNAQQVERALLGAKPGSIVLLHAHRPKGAAFEGLRAALPELSRRGTRFVRLDDVL